MSVKEGAGSPETMTVEVVDRKTGDSLEDATGPCDDAEDQHTAAQGCGQMRA